MKMNVRSFLDSSCSKNKISKKKEKMVMKRYLIFLGIILLTAGVASAQNSEAENDSEEKHIQIKAKKYKGDLLLKIVPRQIDAFMHFKDNGWNIKRARVENGDTSRFRKLNDEPVKPVSREEWEFMAQNNETAEAIIDVLFPDQPEEEPQTFMAKVEDHNRLNNQQFVFLFLSSESRKISKASGLEFRDDDLEAENRYIYRVHIKGYEDSTGHYGKRAISPQQIPETFRSPELEGGSLDSAALLVWNHTDFKNRFVSYDIERSLEKENFSRITDVPLVYNSKTRKSDTTAGKMYHVDSLTGNGKKYYYRLIANDYFGMSSDPSNVLAIKGKDYTPPHAPVDVRAQPTSNDVRVVWEYNRQPGDLAGFYVVRSSVSSTGPFNRLHKSLLPASQKRYVDQSAGPSNENFYAVAAFDTAGNYSISDGVSASIRDTVPPKPPQGLEANVDSNGVVELTWELGEAEDIAGYRVYRSVSQDYQFMQVTDTLVAYTGIRDTLNLASLNNEVFYKLVAVDNRYNHSGYSDVLTVNKPDTIAPTKALLTDASYNKGRVKLKWENSTSEDAENQVILQRSRGQSEWNAIDTIEDIGVQEYQVRPGKDAPAYSYAIQTIDENGLKSGLSNIMQVVNENYQEIQPVKQAKASLTNQNNVRLQWNFPGNLEAYRIMIYRSKNNTMPLLYETVDKPVQAFTDTDVTGGNSYQYKIALKRKKDGVVSEKTEMIKIKVKGD
jgi:hypothetical protein